MKTAEIYHHLRSGGIVRTTFLCETDIYYADSKGALVWRNKETDWEPVGDLSDTVLNQGHNIIPYHQPEPVVLDTRDKVCKALLEGRKIELDGNRYRYNEETGHIEQLDTYWQAMGRCFGGTPRMAWMLLKGFIGATIYDPDAAKAIPRPGQKGGDDDEK